MDYNLMFKTTARLAGIKPRKYVFAYCAVPYLLNCFAGHLPASHQKLGEYSVKLSIEAVKAFRDCFPKGEAPEVKIG